MWYNKAMENKKKLLLIDGSSVAYRAFFALYNQIDRFKKPCWSAHQCHLWFSPHAQSFIRKNSANARLGSF